MGFVTPLVVICIFVVVFVVSLIICYFAKPGEHQGSRLHIFITTLSSLAIFVTFLFYYSVVDLQMQQRKEVKVRETSRITNSIQNVFIENIKDTGNIIPNFTRELLPLQNNIENVDIDSKEDDYQCLLAKYTLSYKIFNLWQDIVISHEFLDINQEAIICHCLQRASSEQLKNIWEDCKLEFSEKTQEFGDLLFKSAGDICDKNCENYIEASKKLCTCKEHNKIFADV